MNSKPFYKSKTMWIATIVTIIAWFAPGVAEWVGSHPELTVTGLGLLFTWLRKISHGKVDFGINPDTP